MATEPELVEADSTSHGQTDFDRLLVQVLDGAAERIHAQVDRAQRLGIIDGQGNLVSRDLPQDMQPGAKRDFGG